MNFRHGRTPQPNLENSWFPNCPLIARAKDCALLDTTMLADHLLAWKSISHLDRDAADADNHLRLRANMTILEGLHSETISMGVAIRRDSSLTAHAVPEMGDADQRRDDEVIQVDLGVAFLVGLPGRSDGKARWPIGQEPAGTKIHRAMLLVLVTAALAAVPVQARSQSLLSSEDPSATAGITAPGKLDLTYVRPTERTKVNNYAFDAFGPYPIVGAAIRGGNQPVEQCSAGVGPGR